MRGTDAPILPLLLTAAGNWRGTAATAGVDLVQLNTIMPDGRVTRLTWDENAIDNGDGTFAGDWVIDT